MAQRVCPVWMGYFLLSPLRKLRQNPVKILGPHVRPGMRVLDVGSAMGFFSLPMARMVGESGKVVCVDMQPGMLRRLEKRAGKAGLAERIETRQSDGNSFRLENLREGVDFALAMAMVHEVPDAPRLFREVYEALKPGGRLFVAEPAGHVTVEEFEHTVSEALAAGFSEAGRPEVARSHAALFEK